MKSAAERFWSKVAQVGNSCECWLWTGAATGGYGVFMVSFRRIEGRRVLKFARAHRFSYETLIGPVPGGLELDHLCKETACVNPAHLEQVTKR